PRLQQDALINFCKERDIAVTAWGPLGRGRLLPDDHLAQIAKKYNKTASQLILKCDLERDTIIIPKTITTSRIKEKLEVLDFESNGRTGANSSEPDFMKQFEGM